MEDIKMKTKELPTLQEMIVLDEEQQKEVAKTGYTCPDCEGSGVIYFIPLGEVGFNRKQYTCGRCGGMGKVITRRSDIRRTASRVEYLYLPIIADGGDLLFAIDGVVHIERRKRVQRAIDKN